MKRSIRASFGYNSYGDDLHLWYVGLTRCRLLLSLPGKLIKLYDDFRTIKSAVESGMVGREAVTINSVEDTDNKPRPLLSEEVQSIYTDLVLPWETEMKEQLGVDDVFEVVLGPSIIDPDPPCIAAKPEHRPSLPKIEDVPKTISLKTMDFPALPEPRSPLRERGKNIMMGEIIDLT